MRVRVDGQLGGLAVGCGRESAQERAQESARKSVRELARQLARKLAVPLAARCSCTTTGCATCPARRTTTAHATAEGPGESGSAGCDSVCACAAGDRDSVAAGCGRAVGSLTAPPLPSNSEPAGQTEVGSSRPRPPFGPESAAWTQGAAALLGRRSGTPQGACCVRVCCWVVLLEGPFLAGPLVIGESRPDVAVGRRVNERDGESPLDVERPERDRRLRDLRGAQMGEKGHAHRQAPGCPMWTEGAGGDVGGMGG